MGRLKGVLGVLVVVAGLAMAYSPLVYARGECGDFCKKTECMKNSDLCIADLNCMWDYRPIGRPSRNVIEGIIGFFIDEATSKECYRRPESLAPKDGGTMASLDGEQPIAVA